MMHKHWLLAAAIGVAVLMVACGGDDGESGTGTPGDNPGGLTADQVEVRVSELLTTQGCDVPTRYSRTIADSDTWSLRASMGVTSFTWTFDPSDGSVAEREGRCKIPAPTAIPIRDSDDSRFFDSDQIGERVKELLTAQGCDTPEEFGFINRIGDIWTLRADIDLVSFLWFYDSVANTVDEFADLCTTTGNGS